MIRVLFIFLLPFTAHSAELTTYEKLIQGKRCVESRSQHIDCEYKIENSFWLTISSVGEKYSGISFMNSNQKDEYYARYGLAHGCVIVETGAKNSKFMDYAFISSRTGKIYHTVTECNSERKLR